MITEINLINFKSFRKQPIKLTELNILTGINGTGKSTVIQSILMIMQSDGHDYIENNGNLVELGDYSDIQHEKSEEDTLIIEVSGFSGKSSWGFENNEDVSPSVDKLPAIRINPGILDFIRAEAVYISAERWGPRQNVPLRSYNSNPYWLGKHGEFTIQFLHSLSEGGFRDKSGNLKSSSEIMILDAITPP